MVSAQSVWRAAFAVAAIAVSGGLAQSPSTTPASSTPSVAPTTTVVSVSTTLASTAFSRSGASASVPFSVAAIPTVLNVTSIITPTPTSSASPSSSASASPTPTPITLATKLDPAFGVLGAILILIGIPCAFLGHKNRWTSFFLVGFYTLSLVCIVIIIRFGVLDAVNPPSPTVRGMFVLASFVAGVAGGGIAIFFWKAARFFIGAWGGFALGLFVQCFRNGGLIKPIGLRWILYIGCAVVGFVACTLPKIHYHVLLVSTAFIGASSIMLGVDCYTTAGLKEFYIWNLGFNSLFPKFTSAGIQFPVSQTMQIELGLIGAIAFMGAAVQLRILKVLQRKLHEIQEEQRRRDAVDDAKAAERFLDLEQEKREWDAQHPSYGKHMRQDSDFSGMPLMAKDKEAPSPDPESSLRARRQSGLSEFMTATPTFDDDIARRAPVQQQQQQPQRLGVLPALDLGADIQDDVPQAYISAQALDPAARASKLSEGSTSDGSRKRRETLLTDIGDIRRSIDLLQVMNSGSGSGSERDRDRKTSFASRRTLSYDLATAVLPEAAHARPPRARVHSMELGQLSTIGASEADPIAPRPTSAPLRDEDWDAYVRERKLVQPPQGVTAPIPTTELPLPAAVSARPAMSPAVQDAVARRQKRESRMGIDTAPPVAPVPRAHAHARPGSYIPPTILPPAKRAGSTSPVQADRPQAPRTVTYEELTERHRAKMREMQSPLTMEERERDEVERAKARWERSRVAEKADVERRQAKEREEKVDVGAGKPRHSRSASADRLAGAVGGAGSKRASVLKVEDWQRYQRQEARGVAFPGATTATSPGGHGERRGSKRMSSGLPSPRDPPT